MRSLVILFLLILPVPSLAQSDFVYKVGHLKPVDSRLRVQVGQKAPDFVLPSISGQCVRLSDFYGKKNIMLSFVPAAWTPVCSDQWPGYNILQDFFKPKDGLILGMSVDNIPTLHAWVEQMGGLWFPVLSDFWPHGQVAAKYGVLRGDGTAERAIFIINKQGIIKYIDVHDINERPKLEPIIQALQSLS